MMSRAVRHGCLILSAIVVSCCFDWQCFTYESPGCAQFRVEAADNRSPPGTGQATVIINVQRNENGPVFAQKEYSVTISEYQPPATSIFRVQATDLDNPSVSKAVARHFVILLINMEKKNVASVMKESWVKRGPDREVAL
jgi:hypothetical protein